MSSKNVEEIKAESRSLRGTIQESLGADSNHFSEDEYQVLKFHGTYQQELRGKRRIKTKTGTSWCARNCPAEI
jgi:sulfite reductase (ferredoxin)